MINVKEVPPLTESHLIEGFYEIEGFSRYLINPDGLVYDLARDVIINTYYDKGGYLSVSVINDYNGKRTLQRHHRLVGIALVKERPDNYRDLVINHKDSIRDNNAPSNLEWVTQQENYLHGVAIGVHQRPEGPRRDVPIQVKDVIDGDVLSFKSMYDAAAFLDTTPRRIAEAFRKKDMPLILHRFLVRYLEQNPLEWRTVSEYELAGAREWRIVEVRHAITGEVNEFPNCMAAATYLNVTKDTVAWRCNDDRELVYPDMYQYRYKSDKPWRPIKEDLRIELLAFGTSKAILLRNLLNGEITEFATQRLLAEHLGIHESAVTQWLACKDFPVRAKHYQIKSIQDERDWPNMDHWVYDERKQYSTQKIIRRTLPDGTTVDYDSINAASRATGIGLSSISFKVKRGKPDKKGELWEVIG